ncbi:helix-turn-helix domain-containing protein [Streptomyces sp. ISL-66]|uniref:PucR family transcriptional regulator n=1 Tax=Streptomyces sp. ISL-66 TaxID=2819186 RepID=UPI001BEBE0F8|nr:PucR family transcriptional regulator [Streptomyces sp. ISL-66]MBT2468955.1 helix-turn-helix domain-containing protein [Streptomyces sp. ISL-66]
MERIIEEIREDLDRRLAVAAERLADRAPVEDPAHAAHASYTALLGRAELCDRIHHILGHVVEGLVRGSRGLPAGLADARADGALRAGQGLPLASLLGVYRLCGRLLWQTLTEAVAAHDRAALPRLLPGAPALWEVVDRLADAAAESYHRAESARGDRERELAAALLDTLLEGSGSAEEAAGSAERLGLPERGRFAVVVLGPGGGDLAGAGLGGAGTTTGAEAETEAGTGVHPAPGAPRLLWRIRAAGESCLVELGHHPLESVRELLAPLGVRAGVSPVVASPAELAGAHRMAVLALRTAVAEGPRTALLDERLPAALVAAEPELAARLRRVVLGPVLALPPEDRRVLLNTLGTWLTCQGSTTYAAQRLYCHRNTVSNRLRRLERLTGRSLSDPAHVVELALAHAAVVQRPASAVPPAPAPSPSPSPPSGASSSRTPAGTARRLPRPRA